MSPRLPVVVFAAIFAALLLLEAGVSARSYPRILRSIKSEAASTKSKLCYKSAPCGWAIYVPYTREIVDYMPNTCKCPEDTSCVRADDDLSVSAYVHRCRPNNQVSDPDENLQHVFS